MESQGHVNGASKLDHMQIEMLKCKIHRATVTDANLDYEGSITIDRDLMDAAGLVRHEKVHVLNLNNGSRFETYVIEGERASRVICVNGAAARLVLPKDKVIIISYCFLSAEESKNYEPVVVKVDSDNNIIDHLPPGYRMQPHFD